jgi:hypothetical protein
VNYTNSNNCTAASAHSYPVTVNALPVPTVTGPADVCAGSTGNVYTTEAGMTNYIWNVSAGGTITSGGTSTSNSITITWNTAGAQNVSVNYSDAGCPAVSPILYPVTVNSLPVPTITGPASICATTSGNVYTTQTGMTNYVWSISAGGTITAGGTSTSNTVTVTWNTAGAESVSVNYTNANSCSALAPGIYNVTVNPSPDAPAIGTITQPTCTLATGGVVLNGLPSGTWTINPGSISGSGESLPISGLSTGTHSYTVTNAANCTSLQSANIVIDPQPESPTVSLGSNTTICANQSILLDAGNAGASYQWTPGGQTSQTKTVDTTGLGLGVHTISVLVTAANTCSATGSIEITFDACTGIAEASADSKIEIYPVPNDGRFNVSFNSLSELNYDILIYNSIGVVILEEKNFKVSGKTDHHFDIANAPVGTYYIQFISENEQIVKKIIIVR